jgi:hypothetical protein
MTSRGQLNCEWSPEDTEKHTDINLHGSSCLDDLKSINILMQRKLYRFGFDMCLPYSANKWNQQFVIAQIWSDAGLTNPPISLGFDGRSGSINLTIRVRGDSRSGNQFQSSGKKHQFFDSNKIARNVKAGSCHNLKVEFILDEKPGGSGMVVVWMDGKKVYDLSKRSKNAVQVGYAKAHWTPFLGIYATNEGNVAMNVTYDKIWLEAP